MSEDTTSPDDAARTGPQAGERLAEARRLRQISLPEIARELHLDEPKVQALEENRFAVLGAPVFAKGHLRKYAEIVGVSVEEVMTDYRALTSADLAPPVVGEPRQRPPRDINLGPWLVAIPVVLVVAGVAWWWLGRAPAVVAPAPGVVQQPTGSAQRLPRATVPLESGSAATGPAASGAITADASSERTAEPTASDTAAAPSVTAAPAASSTAPEARAPAVAGQVDLRLTYSGDCWTEVTDAGGRRLFFDLGRNGRTVSVSGTAPLRVLLGDSTKVRLTVNGAPYAIENAEFRGDTARLTINQ